MRSDRSRGLAWALLLLAASSLGCASTELDGSWRDPKFAGPAFRKVLVVGVSKQADARRQFEDRLVADLRARGVEGVPSYTLIPEDGPVAEPRLREATERSGASAVLLTRLLGVRQKSTTYVDPGPGYAGGLYGYYGYSAWDGPLYDSATTYQYNVYTLETKLFDVAGDRLVWAGTTTTEDPINRKQEIRKLSQLITDALAKQKLI